MHGGGRHADHFNESDYRSEDHPANVQPRGMQPVVEQFAQNEAQQDSAGNNEADLRVAGDDTPGIAIVSIWTRAHRERLAEIRG